MNITFILLIISPALCILMFIYFKWYIKQRTSESGVLKETNLKVRKWINEVDLSIAEINAVTDRNLLLVEDKIKKLNEILEDTDKRSSVYVKEIEKSRASEALYTQLGRGVRAAIKTEPAPVPQSALTAAPPLSLVRPNIPVAVEQTSQAKPAQPTQPMLPLEESASAITAAQPAAKPVKPQKSSGKKQIRISIDQLAGEGLSSQEIASRLGISIAEVDLAIQLQRRG
jgi:predicted DNA-binding protein YlxM (UPF0122 family)